jgi:hypothetical protein
MGLHATRGCEQPMQIMHKECLDMDPKRNCTERMRPFLKAMERSIESARRSRTNQSSPVPGYTRPEAPAPPPSISYPRAESSVESSPAGSENPQRLKARPKRADLPLIDPFAQSEYRSRAS